MYYFCPIIIDTFIQLNVYLNVKNILVENDDDSCDQINIPIFVDQVLDGIVVLTFAEMNA